MTKLEELKAALAAAGSERWEAQCLDSGNWIKSASGTVGWTEYNGQAEFIALSHNLMPTLLEAIDLLETVSSARACQDHEFDVDAWFKQVRSLLGDLK